MSTPGASNTRPADGSRRPRRARSRTLAAVSLADNRSSIDQAVGAGLLRAVTCVWHRGEVLQVNEIGHRDIEAGLDAPRHHLRVASMTVSRHRRRGDGPASRRVDCLADPITRWVPELADLRVLVDPTGPLDDYGAGPAPDHRRDLMTHRSGWPAPFRSSARSPAYAQVSLRQDADDWLADISWLGPLMHHPASGLIQATPPRCSASSLSRIEDKALADRAV